MFNKIKSAKFYFTKLIFFIFLQENLHAANIDEAVEAAVFNNRNIKYRQYKVQASESQKSGVVGEFLPEVSANLQYGNKHNRISNGDDFSNKERVEEIRVEQPIFDGFGSVAKYNSAKYDVKSSQAQKSNTTQEIIMRAANSYCDLYLAQESLKVNEENREIAKKIAKLVKNRKNSRVIDNADFIKYNYEILELEQEFFDATNKLALAKAEYENIVGIDDFSLVEPIIAGEEINFDEALQSAATNNSEVKTRYYSYLSAKSQHNSQKSEFSPKLSVVASAAKQHNVVYLNQNDLNTQAIYLNLSVPIFQKGVEYANLSKARNERDAAREEYEIARQNVQKEMKKALEEYELSAKLVESSKYLLELADERFEIFNQKSRKKLIDRIEFLRAKIEYNKRFVQHLEAKMRFIKAYYAVKFYQS